MKVKTKKGLTVLAKASQYVHVKTITNPNAIAVVAGSALITAGLTDIALAQDRDDFGHFEQARIQDAVRYLLSLIEGALGALIMVVAGIGAIVAAAMGAYRAAVGMLVVAVGAFILRSLVTLFFGKDFDGKGVETGG